MKVLAMLRCGARDRRLLGAPPGTGGGGALPRHPCAFQHDVRARAGVEVDGAAVIEAVSRACGDLLSDAFEVPAEEGERRWRLVLSTPCAALDDRAAYQAYQAARGALRTGLGLELR